MRKYTIYSQDRDEPERMDYVVHARNDGEFEKLFMPVMNGEYTRVYRVEADGYGGFKSATYRPVIE